MVLRNVQPTFTFEEQRVEINELAADVDTISTGYNNTNWDTAFSWGNHATQNYIVNGTFSNVTINAGITTRNLTITDDGSASPIFICKADDNSVWNLSLQNDGYSTSTGTGTKFFMNTDGTAKWYHYGYSEFESTEFYTARVVGSPSSYLAFKLNQFGGSELLYQGGYRAGSTSWGLNVTGNLYASQGMDIPDGYSFQAGNGDDLRLGHNATSSYIDNYTGALDISNYADDQDITLRTDSGTGGIATYLRCDGSSGAVILGHYGNQKFITTSTGVEITGTVVSDPTAAGVAGYGYELKNGATSLGGLYKTSSNGGYLQLNNSSGTVKASINGEDGSAQFGEASGNVVSINTDGKLTARNSSSSATVVLATNFNGTDNFTVAANGSVVTNGSGSFGGTLTVDGVLTAGQRLVVNQDGTKSGTENTFLNYAGDGTTATVALTADGAATFSETLTIGSGSAAPDDYGLIAYANSDSLSNKSAVYARNLNSGGRTFTGDNESGATTFEVYANGTVNASGTVTTPFLTASNADAVSVDTALFRNTTSGGNNRIRINTLANGGGHPYIKFDSGGSNMIVGQLYAGTTNNKLVLGVGDDPTGVTGLEVFGTGIVNVNAAGEGLRLEPTTTTDTSYIGFRGNTSHYGFVGAANQLVTSGQSDDFVIRAQNDLILSVSTTPKLTVRDAETESSQLLIVRQATSIGNAAGAGVTLFDLGPSNRAYIARGFIVGFGSNADISFEITGVTGGTVTVLHTTTIAGSGSNLAFSSSGGTVTVTNGIYNANVYLTMLEYMPNDVGS